MTNGAAHRRLVEFFAWFLSPIVGRGVFLKRLSGPWHPNGHDLEIKAVGEVRGDGVDAGSFLRANVERDTGGIEPVLQLQCIRQAPDRADRHQAFIFIIIIVGIARVLDVERWLGF